MQCLNLFSMIVLTSTLPSFVDYLGKRFSLPPPTATPFDVIHRVAALVSSLTAKLTQVSMQFQQKSNLISTLYVDIFFFFFF